MNFKTLKLTGILSALMISSLAFANTTQTSATTSEQTQQGVQNAQTDEMTTTTQISTDETLSKTVKDILDTNKMGLTATVSEGVVSLSGSLADATKLKDVVEAIKAVPGVKEVKLDEVKAMMPEVPQAPESK